ncbi:MerR family transcriptional regulator [Candidatus Puniceispirillum sp.]|mgnify:CR=1 FL=1|jgi:DNA-binding transcriptional MerR regulator|uniref:MerR family transcriptional regulator n=1 Tax=Candidatus Puniceispirillum sp. TaxID=2026719 RepID=UPI001EBF463E|nr:MerR family transcriptional regulator [Candidatus Puniceispirillum sp.]MBT6566308.1 MerR family transcriptional regulator [Candidatus Puniceispirillum sp.]
MKGKADDAFRTISEVSEMLDIPAHVLRFWETKFSSLRPLKRSGGRRYYRPTDVALLERIRDLLYKDGFTIKGAQKFLRSKVESPASMDDANDTSSKGDVGMALANALALLQDAKNDIAKLRLTIAS